jgi:hypothetical protein
MKTVYMLCALATLTGCQPKVQRYVIADHQLIIIKMDTKTGESWQWHTQGQGWKPIPVQL